MTDPLKDADFLADLEGEASVMAVPGPRGLRGGPVQRADGRWVYGRKHDGRPMGFCNPFLGTHLPEGTEFSTAPGAERLAALHGNGHATFDEAVECFGHFLVVMTGRLDPLDGERPTLRTEWQCEALVADEGQAGRFYCCAKWTTGSGFVDGELVAHLCPEHLTMEELDGLYVGPVEFVDPLTRAIEKAMEQSKVLVREAQRLSKLTRPGPEDDDLRFR